MTVQPSDLALGWLTVGGQDPLAWLDAASAGGFGHLGVKVAPRPGETAPALLHDVDVRKAFDARRKNCGVQLLNMGSIWLDGRVPVHTYQTALDVGAALGAKYVIAISTDPDRARRLDDISELISLAQDRHLRVAIEFFAYSEIPNFQQALDTVANSPLDQVGILFDALHFHRSGGHYSEISESHARHIDYFQLCDGPQELPVGMSLSEEGRANRMFAGDGDIPLRQMLAQLPSSILMEVEIPHPSLKTLSPQECGREVMARTMRFMNQER